MAQDPGTQLDNVAERLASLLAEVDTAVWFWLGAAIVVPRFLPRSWRWPFFAIAVTVAVLPSATAALVMLLVMAVVLVRNGLIRVPEGYTANVLRLGKFSRTLTPGLHFLIPGLETVNIPHGLCTIGEGGSRIPLHDSDGYISTKEVMLDPDPHDMICSDNSVVKVDSICYFRIVKAGRAAFAVENLGDALLKLTETVLRQEVGKLDADAVIASRDLIGARLLQALSVAAEPWGTIVVRVEIQNISFHSELQEQLTRAREAELAGRAKVVQAERSRDAAIAVAEGEKRAAELKAEAYLAQQRAEAEGQFLSESRKREGEAAGLRAIADALRDTPEAMVALEAIKRQPEVAAGLGQSNGLLVVPSEAAGLLGSMASLMRTWDAVRQHARSKD